MPGAEVAGLAMGAIALAALFNTCIELFDYFELGKNYVYDYELACTKVELLRARLHAWGNALHVTEPGAEDPVLRALWPANCDIVAKSLLAMRTIFQSSEILKWKYQLRCEKSSKWSFGLRRRSAWAIHDKTKFDLFIQDLAFLIDNLEKVAKRVVKERRILENPTAYRKVNEKRSYKQGDSFSGQPRLSRSDDFLEFQTHEPCDDPQFDPQSQQSAQFGIKHIICGTQRNSGSAIGVQGLVGSTGDMYCISGVQINSEYAVGIQGAVSPEALVYLHGGNLTHERPPMRK